MQIHALKKTRVTRRDKIKTPIKFSQELPLRVGGNRNKGVRPPGSRKLISARAGDSVNRARRNRRSSGSTHRVESYGARFFIRNRHSTSNRWITTFSRGPRGSREGESAKRGWDLKGAVRYFSFKGNERHSEFIKSTRASWASSQIISMVLSILVSSFHFGGGLTAARLYVIMPCIMHCIIRHVFPSEDVLARNLEHERVATCNTSPNRLSYDAVRYPLRLAVPAILGAGITYRLVARAFSRKGSSLALLLTKCRGFCARSYNLRGAPDDFLDGREVFDSSTEEISKTSRTVREIWITWVAHREGWKIHLISPSLLARTKIYPETNALNE